MNYEMNLGLNFVLGFSYSLSLNFTMQSNYLTKTCEECKQKVLAGDQVSVITALFSIIHLVPFLNRHVILTRKLCIVFIINTTELIITKLIQTI